MKPLQQTALFQEHAVGKRDLSTMPVDIPEMCWSTGGTSYLGNGSKMHFLKLHLPYTRWHGCAGTSAVCSARTTMAQWGGVPHTRGARPSILAFQNTTLRCCPLRAILNASTSPGAGRGCAAGGAPTLWAGSTAQSGDQRVGNRTPWLPQPGTSAGDACAVAPGGRATLLGAPQELLHAVAQLRCILGGVHQCCAQDFHFPLWQSRKRGGGRGANWSSPKSRDTYTKKRLVSRSQVLSHWCSECDRSWERRGQAAHGVGGGGLGARQGHGLLGLVWCKHNFDLPNFHMRQ